MGNIIKVVRSNEEGNVIADFRQKQHAANDRPLRLETLWRLAIEQFAEAIAALFARWFFYGGHRVDPSFVKTRVGEREIGREGDKVA